MHRTKAPRPTANCQRPTSYQPQLRRVLRLEEGADLAGRLAGDQLARRLLVPVAGEEARVGLLREAAAEKRDDADIGLAADDAAGRLHHARHAGDQVRELEARAVLLVVV